MEYIIEIIFSLFADRLFTKDLHPETKYAKSGNVNIAYQVADNGPGDKKAR